MKLEFNYDELRIQGNEEALTGRFMERLHSGLCTQCKHAELIRTAKGSAFLKCARSKMEQRFPKYPKLPVTSCLGYESSVKP